MQDISTISELYFISINIEYIHSYFLCTLLNLLSTVSSTITKKTDRKDKRVKYLSVKKSFRSTLKYFMNCSFN